MKDRVNSFLNFVIIGCWVISFGPAVTGQKISRQSDPPVLGKSINEPTVFAEGIISGGDFDSHPAFMPDGKTLYFVRSTPTFSFWTILVSRFERGRWGVPQVAPFSGEYSDADPFITADGKRLYFISNRPFAGKKSQDLDIWFVEADSTGAWGKPQNAGSPINSDGAEWYPTIARSGNIYFGSDRPGGKGRTDIYRARLVNGKYAEAENLGESINTQFNEFEPFIAPDERFLIFMAGGRADGKGGFDLYVSYNRDGLWTKPLNLGDKINSSGNEYSPTISPDGKYFFWTSTRSVSDKPRERALGYRELMNKLRSPGNGLGDIYQLAIDALNLES